MSVTNPMFLSSFAQAENFVKLVPSDDAHVLTDLNDSEDTGRLMQTNAGSLESIQLFSSWNATENENTILTIGYLKFDTTKQKTHDLEKVELRMLTREVLLSETPKNVVVVHVPNNNWSESDITYLKRPSFSTTIASLAAITAPNTWYSWDVTDLVKQNPSAELSVAITFETAKDKTQDLVSFYSKEFPNKEYSPYLALYYTTDSTLPSSSENSNFAAIIISGLVGAGIASFITKSIISKNKSKQSDTKPERVQCKNCGKMLPLQFKFCPFCSTQVNQ